MKVVIVGGGTRINRGNEPTGCDLIVSTLRISGVVEHAAGDMTATVLAGTPLVDLQARLAISGQFLAIDPPRPGTVGGLIATADSGPRRLYYGGVRDMLLGVTFVRADGTIARGGGKVVKNVAGYDLPKLLTGSLGTLAVIVEATFRLYPLPPASATIVVDGIAPEPAAKVAAQILKSGLTPTILDYYVEQGEYGMLATRFESSPQSVEGQAARARALLNNSRLIKCPNEASIWTEMDRIVEADPGDIVARLVGTQSDLPQLLAGAMQHARGAGAELAVRAHVGHGHALLRLKSPGDERALAFLQAVRKDAEAREGNLVVWQLPGTLQGQIDAWGDPGEGIMLMRKVKEQFDPNSTLNPGRFVGGI